jgi:hypothetical protein
MKCKYRDEVRDECGSGDNESWQCTPEACPVPDERKVDDACQQANEAGLS